MTSDTGAWRQTIFYPFAYTSTYGRGTVLNTLVKGPVYDSKTYGDAPYLDAVLVWKEENEELTLFAVNKISRKIWRSTVTSASSPVIPSPTSRSDQR